MTRPRRAAIRITLLAPLITLIVLGAVASWGGEKTAAASFRFVATPLEVIETADGSPFVMPSDVAVGADGRVCIADGVNDRVIVLDSSNRLVAELRDFGISALSRPLGVDVGPAGEVWIADTGNARVLAATVSGELLHEFPIATNGNRRADVTDVAVEADGRRVWFTDNDGDQIGYIDVAGGAVTRIGGSGESLGQFRYPYGLATTTDGNVLVAEAINGRVQVLTRVGQPAGRIGRYGVELGDLFRPKGVAVASDGSVWVSDARIGVVQVFRVSGECLDVLRGSDGAPLRLAGPAGIDFGPDGSLYVVELGANRVRRFGIAGDPGALPAAAKPVRPTNQPRACTACHVEWLSPVREGESTEIFSPPPSTPEQPAVVRPENCRSCHDGTIVDSRRAVWVEHSHPMGIRPSANVTVPENLPLVNGEIQCRTCHTAHSRGGSGDTMATAVFLRVKSEPVELCVACHTRQTDPATGNHPLGELKAPLAPALAEAGAQLSEIDDSMTCLTCHDVHGGKADSLLRLARTGNQLCVSCHTMSFAHAAPGRDIESPESAIPAVEGEQVGFAENLKHAGVACTDCHALHGPTSHPKLLRAPLEGSALCITCHTTQSAILDTAHNMSTHFADFANRTGTTISQSGPCSACHMVHTDARDVISNITDKAGTCMDCHAPTGVAAARALGTQNHPDLACVQCHDPHSRSNENFLIAPSGQLCRTCHLDKTTLLGGTHDVTMGSSAWPDAAKEKSPCLACHMPHGNDENMRFRAGLAASETGADAACLACHTGQSPTAAGNKALIHARAVAGGITAALPMNDDGMIGCITCHDPHLGVDADKLLRTPQPGALVCSECHANAHGIGMTGHAPERLRAAGFESAACGPCHAVHGSRTETDTHLLWPKALRAARPAAPEETADPYCVKCHSPGGVAPVPEIATHPVVGVLVRAEGGDSAAPQIGAAPAEVELYTALGGVATAGGVVFRCRTCHVPHSRGAELLANDMDFDSMRIPWAQIRQFEPPNLCSDCHGADARRRFLFFHDPSRRAGPRRSVELPGVWIPRER